jgi:aspartate/tyrosine/aromatic aminotransferase
MATPRYLQIKDHPHLLRDTKTMGIININRSGLNALQNRRNEILRQKTLEQQQKKEINTLRDEVAELKAMLLELLQKQGKE